jgi:hypothetical protein
MDEAKNPSPAKPPTKAEKQREKAQWPAEPVKDEAAKTTEKG